jgi:hypothetical protein
MRRIQRLLAYLAGARHVLHRLISLLDTAAHALALLLPIGGLLLLHIKEEPESDSSVGEPSEYGSEREDDAPRSEVNSGANDDTPGGSAEPWADDSTEDALAVSQNEPLSCCKAHKRPDAEQWTDAALGGLLAHFRNGTWSLIELPQGAKAVGLRWVFKLKHLPDGSIDRYKARVVAKGYSRHSGFDFFETFVGTPKYQSIHVVLALAAVEDLTLRSVDVFHAFLNGKLEEEC